MTTRPPCGPPTCADTEKMAEEEVLMSTFLTAAADVGYEQSYVSDIKVEFTTFELVKSHLHIFPTAFRGGKKTRKMKVM